MKLTTPLLLASLVANAALVVVVYQRTPSVPSASSLASLSRPTAGTGSDSKQADALRAALLSGDIAALQAAGFSPEVAREIALGRAFARFAERAKTARAGGAGDGQWWRNRPGAGSRELELQALRELSEAMIAAFGDDFGLGGGDNSQFSFLPADKRAALHRITQDYDEMIAKFSASGIQLASDREKLSLLRAERQRDIASLLTPGELAEYEMRTSSSAAMLRARYGDAISSEEEFKKLYALQKAFDDKYPMPNGRVTPETMRERTEAQRQLQADMRAAIGSEAYAALARSADPDLRTVDSLVSRLNLPAGTAEHIADQRDTYAADSQRIARDPSLTPEQRRTQLQELGARAKAGLATTLGSEAADAYAQRSPWMNMLQAGLGFSTNPQDAPMGPMPGGPSVVPVMPAGAGGSGTRQMMNFTVAGDAAVGGPTGGGVFFSAGAVAPIDAARVITFDTIGVGPEVRSGPVSGVITPPGNGPIQSPPPSAPPANASGQAVPAPRG